MWESVALREQARKRKREPATTRAVASRRAVDAAFTRFDRAVEAGDLRAAAREAALLRSGLRAWERRLLARETDLQKRARRGDLDARLERIEHRLEAVRRRLAHR